MNMDLKLYINFEKLENIVAAKLIFEFHSCL